MAAACDLLDRPATTNETIRLARLDQATHTALACSMATSLDRAPTPQVQATLDQQWSLPHEARRKYRAAIWPTTQPRPIFLDPFLPARWRWDEYQVAPAIESMFAQAKFASCQSTQPLLQKLARRQLVESPIALATHRWRIGVAMEWRSRRHAPRRDVPWRRKFALLRR